MIRVGMEKIFVYAGICETLALAEAEPSTRLAEGLFVSF